MQNLFYLLYMENNVPSQRVRSTASMKSVIVRNLKHLVDTHSLFICIYKLPYR